MKFKILPKIHDFTDAQGNRHFPGDIVDLPEIYLGFDWLEPVPEPILTPVEVPVAPPEIAPPKEQQQETAAPIDIGPDEEKKPRKKKETEEVA